MSYRFLSNSLMKEVLDYLDCPVKAPTLRYLNQLIDAYIRRVPWESVSRILKRYETPRTEDCPRWPEEFWGEAMQHGFGGTCFESSLAFYSLLMKLGYEGYLTVNDMGEHRGCHAAIVLLICGKKYLVDITIPIHSAVQFNPHKVTRRPTTFQHYTIRPIRKNRYEVKRSHRPNKIAFTLVDVPVDLQEYRTIVENDYAETGLFLKSVVMVKVIGNRTHRFFSDHKPYKLECFSRDGKDEISLQPEVLADCLSTVFLLPEDKISAALIWIQSPPIEPASQYMRPPSVLNGSLQ